MRADPASPSGAFVAGLLNPASPVPKTVKGETPRRYAVYRNNVTISLIRAMESNFPVVRRLLGAEYFAGFAREFVQTHPPRSPLMFHYGASFGDYLDAAEDLRDYPYLGDIAKLEQQMRLSYHEADAPTLSATALSVLPEDVLMDASFAPHPAMAVVESDYAIHAIYQANQGDAAASVEDVAKSEVVMVVRPVHDVNLHLLSAAEGLFIRSLAAGHSLGAAADAAFERDENFDLTTAVGLLLLPGAFQSIHMKEEQP